MKHHTEMEARRIISAAQQDEEVRELLSEMGYGEEQLGQLEELVAGGEKHNEGRGSPKGIGQASGTEWERASEAYQKLRNISSETFDSNPDAMALMGTRLEQGTPISRKIEAELEGARNFYDDLLNNPDRLEQLKGKGYTREQLEQERTRLEWAVKTEGEQTVQRSRGAAGRRLPRGDGSSSRLVGGKEGVYEERRDG